MLDALPPDPGVGVVILDACRDNPLARTLAASLPKTRSTTAPGLAAVEIASSDVGTGGVLIAYATDPGAVSYDGNGANSPYTTSLAKHLAEPGVDIQSALTRVRGEVTAETNGRQRPWHNASLGREVFIGPATIETAAAAPTPAPSSKTGNQAAEPNGGGKSNSGCGTKPRSATPSLTTKPICSSFPTVPSPRWRASIWINSRRDHRSLQTFKTTLQDPPPPLKRQPPVPKPERK